MAQERCNCHDFYSMLCSYLVHFRLREWWHVLTKWWYVTLSKTFRSCFLPSWRSFSFTHQRSGVSVHFLLPLQPVFTECLCLMFNPLVRKELDKINDPYSFPFPIYVLWDWIHFEHYCYILWVPSCYSIWHDGCCFCHLGFHLFPSGISWHCYW